jgi:hypothetical protein
MNLVPEIVEVLTSHTEKRATSKLSQTSGLPVQKASKKGPTTELSRKQQLRQKSYRYSFS